MLKEAIKEFQKEAPNAFRVYLNLVEATKKTKLISEKNRELIKAAVYTALREPEAVGIHANNAFRAGATREELIEVISLILPNVGLPTASLCLQAALKST